MKKFILVAFALLIMQNFCKAQVDTIHVNTFEEAIALTFGQIPAAHYPSGILIDKAGIDDKLNLANGELNDSIFNVYNWYFYYSKIYFAQADTAFLKKTFIQIDSIKNSYIDTNDVLPIGILNFNYERIKDSAYIKNFISAQNYSLIEQETDPAKIYESRKLFCVSPLNEMVNTLHPNFILIQNNCFTNDTNKISKIEMDLDDGLAYREVFLGQTFGANYGTNGYKNITTRIIYNSGDTLYSRSQLFCNDPNFIDTYARSTITGYDFALDILSDPGTWPTAQFSVDYTFEEATFGVWTGCGNNEVGNIRKPVIIFGGYNPKNGKDLVDNGNTKWIKDNIGPLASQAGWRGPMYETYNGFYTDASINSSHHYGSNQSEFLNKLRAEGYDIVIVKMHDGIGYLQNYANIVTQVIKRINVVKSLGHENPGADINPLAAGYPNTTSKTKPHHENIIIGYSAGALASRMGLLLMEYQHKTHMNTVDAGAYPHHNTKTWVGYDCENQGSNVPIGFQMFADFEQTSFPTSTEDVINMLLANGVMSLLKHRGVATQNTLYHIINTTFGGGQQWNASHHVDFTNFFSDLTAISNQDPAYSNLKGYPVFCRRIGISPGNSNGVANSLANDTRLMEYEQPKPSCFFNLIGFRPYKHATAFAIAGSSPSEHAFYCRMGASFATLVTNWFVEWNHHIYKKDNYINNALNYDVAAGSLLTSHNILGNKLISGGASCTAIYYNSNYHGFSPTVSALDIHAPGNNTLPRYPNLSLTPDNQNLLFQNNYVISGIDNHSPNHNFGYPHIKHPTDHYDITPYDAVCANGDFDPNYYEANTLHVEDPNPYTTDFLFEELAPSTLYLSNRTIHDETTGERYYADFEARNSILAGNQDIYKHDPSNPYLRLQTSLGDLIIENNAVVNMRAGNDDNLSSVVLGAGFSAKAGCIFRAYVSQSYCPVFSYSSRSASRNGSPDEQTPPRSMLAKRATSNRLQETNTIAVKTNLAGYPNPTKGSFYYNITNEEIYNYTVTDLAGRSLETGTLTGSNNQVNLSTFKPGMYLISIKNSNYCQTDRIILQ